MHAHTTVDDIALALSSIGITVGEDETTDPVVMLNILNKINLDLSQLDDRLETVKLLKRIMTEKIPFKPLIEMVLLGIKNNPPLCKTILECKGLNLYSEDDATFSLYFMVILHVLTYLIVQDHVFEKHFVDVVMKNKNVLRRRSTFIDFFIKLMETKGDFFTTIKYISVTPAVFESIACREFPPCPSNDQIEQFILQNKIPSFYSYALKKKLSHLSNKEKNYSLLKGNILEAINNEERNINGRGLLSILLNRTTSPKPAYNALAGLALNLYLEQYQNDFPPTEFKQQNSLYDEFCSNQININLSSTFWKDLYSFKNENNFVKIIKILSKEWVNLYESWNAAFVLRKVTTDFSVVLPKLFIPDTLCAKPECYMDMRAISLWLTIYFLWSKKTSGITKHYDPLVLKKILDIFGKNNYSYAKQVVLKGLPNINLEDEYAKRIQSKSSIALYLEAFKLIQS